MRVYTYSEARQHLSDLLNFAETEEVVIKRRDGKTFSLTSKSVKRHSPFDIDGIEVKATTKNILDAVAASRKQ